MIRNYIILAYKLLPQLNQLVTSLSDEDNSFFYIHVDRRIDITPFRETLKPFRNVVFLEGEERIASYWGSIGTVNATICAMRRIIRDGRQGVIILLSGQDYPIRSNREINDFFEKNVNCDFLFHFPIPSNDRWKGTKGGIERLQSYTVSFDRPTRAIQYVMVKPWDFTLGNFKNILYILCIKPKLFLHIFQFLFVRRKIPQLKFFGSETWWGMRVSTAEKVLDYIAGHPDLLRFFSYVSIPEEIFFATILMNMPSYSGTLKNTSLRFVAWDEAENSSSPPVLTIKHQEKLLDACRQEDILFARKFDKNVDAEIIDFVDRLRLSPKL